MTKREEQRRARELTKFKESLEDTADVRAFKKWVDLDPAKKELLRGAWVKYYEAVKNTRSYKRWQEQREAYKKGDMATVKMFASEAKAQLLEEGWELKQPSSQDPDFLQNKPHVKMWLDVREKLNKLDPEDAGYRTAMEIFA
jgi:hypothetical protein